MTSKRDTKHGPKPQLTLLDAVCIIAGTIIGAGIYESTPNIAGMVGGSNQLLLAFAIGGIVALLGALCYAELATSFPDQGGEYIYIHRAYGSIWSTLFVWFQFWIVRPANVGAVAYVFSRYTIQLIPLHFLQTITSKQFAGWLTQILEHKGTSIAFACVGISIVTALNMFGIVVGKWTQNFLTILKVATLLSIFVIAFVAPQAPDVVVGIEEATETQQTNWIVALVLVMFAFGGWNDLSYVAAEIHNPEKNLPRALLGGTGLVTVAYLLFCLALTQRMGYEGVRDSNVTLNFLTMYVGRWATVAMSIAVAISCLGALHAMVFTGARIFYALGTKNDTFHWLGKWDDNGVPRRALVVQFLVTIGLVIMLGWKEDGFFQLVIFSGPFFFFFFFLTACSLIVLRFRQPDVKRPYRVTGYPIIPILFICFCLGMFISAFNFLLVNRSTDFYLPTIWALIVTLVGVFVALRTRGTSNEEAPKDN